MSYSRRVTQRIFQLPAQSPAVKFFRAPLAAIALFCVVAGMAPQAFAQACGSFITLSANQWRMVGIPCLLAPQQRTIGGAFGASLGVLRYGVTWVAWKRVYDDPNQCAVSSGPADCYVKLDLSSPVATGDAFWIFSTQQAALQFPSTSIATPVLNFIFPARLSADEQSRYYMFANPYGTAVHWANFNFAAVLANIIPVVATTEQAVAATIVSKNVHYWNGNTYFTRDLLSDATIAPKEAAWLEMLKPHPLVTSGVTVIVPEL